MLARLEIRRRWWRTVLLALLVGLVGAVVLSTVAGARRSASALARFNTVSRAGDLEVTVGDTTPAQLRAFRRVAGVESFARLRGIPLFFPAAPQLAAVAEALDTRFGTVVDRARILVGRAADPSAAYEVTIGETLATQLHLGVGDHLDGRGYSPEQIAVCLAGGCSQASAPDGPQVRLRIVGIVRRPLDLGDRGASGGVLITTPAFAHQYERSIGSFGGALLRVRTRNGGADVAQVGAAARRIFGASPQFGVQDLAVDTQGAQSAIDVLSVALWVFAGVAALAGLVAITIVLSREISLAAIDQTTQRALGLTRRQRIAVGGLQAVPVALGGAAFAVVAAALVSPLFPVGVARRAEPDPGLRIDGDVLTLGLVAIIAGVLLIAFVAALRTTRRSHMERSTPRRAATVMAAAGGAGLTPAATTGVRMALEPGRGSTTVPVRSAVFGAVLGLVGIVAVLVFASSLDHLVASPRRYGWTWDFAALPDDPSVFGPQSPLLHERGIAAAGEVQTVSVQLDGRPVTAWGYRPVRGTIGPEIVAGRAPARRNEIALGAATLSELGKRIGDTVHAEGPDGSHDYRIVGRAAFAKLDVPQSLANGAVLTGPGLEAILDHYNPTNGTGYLVVRVEPGATLATVEHRVAVMPAVERPFGSSVPVEIDRLRHVDWLPITLAALLGLLALLSVGHALVTNVRRRRHELAILKTLGFDRRQIRAVVAWQATTLGVVGLIIGVPVGLIVGNLVWIRVASGLGVSTVAAVPLLAVLLTIPCALAAVNIVAFFPARAAARTRPAVALRSE